MPVVFPSPNEAERLSALQSFGVLDTPPEHVFDDLTQLAAFVAQTPVALISFLDGSRQWFKSRYGLETTELPKGLSFCARVLASGHSVQIEDTHLDPALQNNPLAHGSGGFRFYFGVPLCHRQHVLGTLCVADRIPRMLSGTQRQLLERLAHQVMAQLELRRGSLPPSGERAARHRSGPQSWLSQGPERQGSSAADSVADGLGHEINNPLTFVSANLDIALDLVKRLPQGSPGHDELMESLLDARYGAERIARTVGALHAAGRGNPTLAPTSVASAIATAQASCAHELEQIARVRVELAAPAIVMADEARLTQALISLLTSAARAFTVPNPQRNEIRVEVTVHADPTGGQRCVIALSDNRLELGQELPDASQGPPGAQGGLVPDLTRTDASEFGGRLGFDPELGGRATLSFALAGATEGQGSRAEYGTSSVGNGRILVVDDENIVLKAILRVLRSEHDVACYADSRTALQHLLAGEEYDLILCDLMMPNVSGSELHKRLAQERPEQASRLVFMTGGAATDSERRYLGACRNERLTKPFDVRELRELARRYTRQRLPAP